MEIKIINLGLKDFKGTKNRAVSFDGKNVSIYGRNYTGKSTIADAWTWLLFGKNSAWESDFDLKPIGAVRPEVEVAAVIEVDGKEIELKRILREKWTTKRGFAEESFTGHETVTYIDGIERKTTEYKAFIDSLVTEDTFKRLTSATPFLSMKKPDMRKVLLEMAGDISDTQVAGEDEDLNFILSFASEKGLTMSDAAKLVKQNLTAYNAEQQNISPRIDEVRRMMPEEQDWQKLEAGQERGREYLRQIDAQLATGNASLTVMKKKQGEMFALESRIEQLKQSRLEKANQEYRDLLRQKESVEGIIRACRLNEQQFKDTIDEETQNVARYTAELKQLAEDYKRYSYQKKQEASKEYEIIKEGICDRCGQALPEDNLIKINAESEARFTAQKEAEIAKLDRQIKDITERGTELSNRKKDRLERSEKAKAGLAKATEERQIAEKTLEDLSQKLSGQTLAIAIDLTGDIEYEKMLAEVNRLKSEIEKPEDNSVLLENKEKITRQMETIRKLLEGRSERVRAQERIEQLENRGKELSGLIAIEKRKQIAIENFNRRKAEMLEESINDLFDGVTFRLFEQQINGGIADDCTPLINGVEFKDASHSEQIRAGQSIVNAFQTQEHTFVPVFIDNAEACNYFIPMQTQVIKLFVSEDEQIRIVKEQ